MDHNKNESNDDNKVQPLLLTSNSQSFDGDGQHWSEKSCWINRIDQENIMVPLSRSHEEDVYEDLCYVTLRLNERTKQNEDLIGDTKGEEKIQKRDYCLKELVETEKNYCDALEMIINQFVNPLTNLLHWTEIQIIFQNLNSLFEVHKKLYRLLYRACNAAQMYSKNASLSTASSMPVLPILCQTKHGNNSFLSKMEHAESNLVISNSMVCSIQSATSNHDQNLTYLNLKISQCFLNLRDDLLMYGEYCANLPKAQQMLDRVCSQNEQINQSIIGCQNKANDGRFKLRDLLSLPMQRILKYHLLLGELIRNTNENHHDYDGLKEAYDAMLDIGAYINEVKRDTETLEIISDVQRSIVDLSMPDNYELKDYGRLIKDGQVKMRSFDNTRLRVKNRYIFIFDKVMLMCKTLRDLKYSYKEAIVLEEYKIEETPLSTISKLTKNWAGSWSLVHVKTKQPYTFYVKTEDSKRKWLEAIQRAQENVCPKYLSKTDHKFTMSTVAAGKCCFNCNKLMKGTWYQGYLCYVCNVVVHKQCIETIIPCAQCILFHSHSKNELNVFSKRLAGENDLHLTNLAKRCHGEWNEAGNAPPTPSRTKRMLAKASMANGVKGQLMFEENDTILVYASNGTSWFGRNMQTGDEGPFFSHLVSEIVTDDSPVSSSIDSPTVNCTPHFFYDEQQQSHTIEDLFGSKKFSTDNTSPNWNPISLPSTPAISSMENTNIFFNNTTDLESSTQINVMPNRKETVEDDKMRLFIGNGYNLEEYAWFAGSMDRETAEMTLNSLPNGSFLVRISAKQKNSYAISINYKGQVKHMRVQVTYRIGITNMDDIPNKYLSNYSKKQTTHFYLSERRYFRTIVDLVRWYEMNSLSESFNMVKTELQLPYKKVYCHQILGHAIALYSFTGTSSAASSFLSLRKGDCVTVLSRAAEEKGWWKGEIGDRIGYFPFKYVQLAANSLNILLDGNQLEKINKIEPNDHQLNEDGASLKQVCSVGQENQSLIKASVSSNSSSSSTCSVTTLSSPVNSDTLSIHSRQVSSDDAGIDIAALLTTD